MSKHNWIYTNNTMSVAKCLNCGATGFLPNPLPEYGCSEAQND